MKSIKYSIIIPVYNAEKSLKELAKQLFDFFETKQSYELIFVDDFSKDNSWEELKSIQKNYSNITIVKMAKNFGQHGTTLCGLKYASGEYAITIDDDLEIKPTEIQKLINKQKELNADLVYGLYAKKNNSLLRNMLTILYKIMAKIEGKNKGKGSSFRMIRKDLYTKLVSNHKQFVFIDELCLWYTENVAFVGVDFNSNHYDKQRYKTRGLIRITSNLILFSSSFPLKLVTYLGLILATSNFVIGIYFLLKKIFFKIDYPGFTAIIVSVLFSTGLIIFSLGIIAQYIRHLLRNINNAPSYNESEVLPPC